MFTPLFVSRSVRTLRTAMGLRPDRKKAQQSLGLFPSIRHRVNFLRNHLFPLLWLIIPLSVLRLVPGTSAGFGPPRRAATWADYRARNGGEWIEVFEKQVERLPAPYFCGDATSPLRNGTTVTWKEAGVGVLNDARVIDEHAWVVGADDTFIGDFCYAGNGAHSRVYHILKLHRPRYLPGRTLNLCSANAVTNFFHYVIDSVSRFELVRRAGFRWDDFDHVLLPRFRSRTTAEIDAALGIPPDKMIRIGRREQLRCEQLFQPSFPGPLACIPRWVVAFYRELLPARAAAPFRRIYLPRRGNRHPAHEALISARLAELGFETLDPANTPQLRERLAEASHVVGVHGAALTNLVFCLPGTRVLEIMPTEISQHYNRSFYYTLCAGADLPYGVVIGRSRRQRLTTYSPQPKTEFYVAPEDLERGIEALLSSSSDVLRPAAPTLAFSPSSHEICSPSEPVA